MAISRTPVLPFLLLLAFLSPLLASASLHHHRLRPGFQPSAANHAVWHPRNRANESESELNTHFDSFDSLPADNAPGSSGGGSTHRKGPFAWLGRRAAGLTSGLGFIFYHGGPVMTAPIGVHLIYYGSWPQASRDLMEGFIRSINAPSNGGDASAASVAGWWALTTSYFQRKGLWSRQQVAGQVTLAGTTSDAYSQGKGTLADSDIRKIISAAITTSKLPYDASAVYFVLTSPDVTVSGFCSQFCGYHDYFSVSPGRPVKYSFVGDASQCLKGCAAQSTSPNGLPGVDGSVSILAHELAEAASDPVPGTGWLSFKGEENADMCAWKFGSYLTASNAAGTQFKYNLVGGGGAKYLVQMNWDRASQGCKMQG